MAQVTALARVLVVDDDEAIRSFVSQALQQAGYEVVSASSSREGLRLIFARPRFDVFVLDVMMPGMSGDELGRRLRARDPDAKILYFTGFADRLFGDNAPLGANDAVLDKPVTMIGLCEAVSLLLFGHTRGGSGVHDDDSGFGTSQPPYSLH
jgi:two-component system cell cycle sensor histidine kinase/response regulator CckA